MNPLFQKKDTEAIAGFKKISTFASAIERDALVNILVR